MKQRNFSSKKKSISKSKSKSMSRKANMKFASRVNALPQLCMQIKWANERTNDRRTADEWHAVKWTFALAHTFQTIFISCPLKIYEKFPQSTKWSKSSVLNEIRTKKCVRSGTIHFNTHMYNQFNIHSRLHTAIVERWKENQQ